MPRKRPIGTSADLEINKRFEHNQLVADDLRYVAVDVAEESTWGVIDKMVDAYWTRYAVHLSGWKKFMAAKRTRFGLALEGDLKKASFRHQLEIPMFPDPVTGEPDSLGMHLEHIDKQIFKDPRKVREFARRHPEFQVPDYL
jgi:hypothetical protein